MITDLFLKFYSNNDATVKRALTGVVVGGITLAITKLGFNLSEELSGQISAGVALVVNWAISEIVASIQAKRAAELQQVVNKVETSIIPTLNTDGQIGDKTLGTVEKMADILNQIPKEDLKKANAKI